jgi:tetratricopeptide (TPR) repeat protein
LVLVYFIFFFLTSGHAFSASPETGPVQVQVSFQNDTVHLEMTGRQTWKYDMNRKDAGPQTEVQLEVDSLSQNSIASLEKFKSQLVKAIQVKRNTTQGKDTIIFKLSDSKVEHFDYLTDEPSRLIVDFYNTPEVKKATNKKAKANSSAQTAKKQKRSLASETLEIVDKGPLNVDTQVANYGLFDGADPDFQRFVMKDYEIKEESIIKNKDRFYIPYPWLIRQPKKWNEVLESGFVYNVQPTTGEENKQMRLLERLFEKNRLRVFLQTKEWFNEKYPDSKYAEMIDFMTADVKWKLYEDSKKPQDFDNAIQAYKNAIQNNPKSPMSEKTSLLIPVRLFEKDDYLAALRSFNQLIENKDIRFSSNLSRDLARLGVALSYMHLKRFNEAEEELKALEKSTVYEDIKNEAAYRLGDVSVLAKQYAQAVENYSSAQAKYPIAQSQFPGSFFNKSEAEFWLGNYKKSLEDFREYIKKFPADTHAPLALTRIGENMEILGADKSRTMGAYLEAYFRFGETPNAIIARIRMTAGRMKSMKPKEVEIATQQILDLSKKVDLPDVDKLATILISEGYSERGDYEKATQLLVNFYQKNPTMPDAPQFTKRITANINERLRESVEKGNFIEALKTHQQYSDSWLKGSDRLDTRFFIGRSFELAGVNKEAEKYFKEILNRLQSVEGTKKEKEIRVVEHLPSKEQLYLRLAEVQSKQSKLQESYDSLKQIRVADTLTDDEQIERVILSANLLTEKEQFDSAKRFVMELLRTWKGEPDKMVVPYMKLAEIESKSGQTKNALASLKRIDELLTDSKSNQSEILFKSLEKRIEISEKTKNKTELVNATQRMLELFEETKPIASIRYKLGEIYYNQGAIKKAEQAWTGFKGAQADFWGNLAKEQMKNLSWRDDYKKYIERIPAMSQGESK